jgi:predicted component of type VI protein secretion system
MPEFIVRSGKYDGKKFVLPGAEVLIGRDDGCQIRITSQDVSRKHCLIRLTETGWTMRDLGSQNGTYLNDVLSGSESPLRPGDRLRVGPMVLEFADPSVQATVHSVAAAETATRSASTTDDEIASWLSHDSIPAALGDTTIVRSADAPPPPEDDTATSIVAREGRDPERKFDTIAEEAADIIRRHKQMLLQEERDAAG